jgi:hypothetical protein
MSVSNIFPSKWLSVTNFKLLVCVAYRPPGTTESFWDNFDYSLEQALNFTENIIITGDLNVDYNLNRAFLSHKYLEKYTRERHPQNCFYLF